MKILIIAAPDDGHARPVAEHLRDLGAHVDFLRYDEVAAYELTYRLGSKGTFARGEEILDLEQYASIWYRRPGALTVEGRQFIEPWIQAMVASEWRASVSGIINSLPVMWVNHPIRDYECGQKLFQLETAARAGLAVPATIVTNRPEVVKDFYDEFGGKVIYKLIGESTGQLMPNYEGTGIPTLPLREFDLQHLDQVRSAPHQFQQMVEKAFDLRVTIVGKRFFAARIHSQTGQGKIDWRHDYSVEMEPIQLPAEIETRCLDLMSRLKLNYGAMDFCQTKDGQLVFIECNSAGQFYWQELRTKQAIVQEMALLLAGQRDPLIRNLFD